MRGDSVSLKKVTVRPPGIEPFELSLWDAPVQAHLPRAAGNDVRLDVTGVLAFHATTRNVWLSVKTRIAPTDGMVAIQSGSLLVHAFGGPSMVTGDAVMDADDVLESENDKEPDESVLGVSVPCAALGLEWLTVSDDFFLPDDFGHAIAEPGEAWNPKRGGDRLLLRALPRADARSLWMSTPGRTDPSAQTMERLRDQGDWMLVRTAGGGVTVRGWVLRSDFDRQPDPAWWGSGGGCTGDHDSSFYGARWANGKPAGLYEGPAVARAGTPVFASDTQGPRVSWATFRAEAPIKVSFVRGQKWAEVIELPNVGEGLLNASVEVERLVIPQGGTPAP